MRTGGCCAETAMRARLRAAAKDIVDDVRCREGEGYLLDPAEAECAVLWHLAKGLRIEAQAAEKRRWIQTPIAYRDLARAAEIEARSVQES